jgi:hypothetical protein
VRQNALRKRATYPDSPKKWKLEDGGKEGSVHQVGGVGNENLLEHLQAL